MSDSSTQSTLLKSLGGFGGQYVTGESNITGSFLGIQSLTETTVLSDTLGNVENIVGAVIPAGMTILGEWTIIHTSGDCIIYNR